MSKKHIQIQESELNLKPFLVIITRAGWAYGYKYFATMERVQRIVNIVKHNNFYFGIDGGKITLFGEYGVPDTSETR